MSKILPAKKQVWHNDCGYNVYKIGTPVNLNGNLYQISNVFISSDGEIIYTLNENPVLLYPTLYPAKDIDEMVLSVPTANDKQ
jgi:hypothetical protein